MDFFLGLTGLSKLQTAKNKPIQKCAKFPKVLISSDTNAGNKFKSGPSSHNIFAELFYNSHECMGYKI